MFANRIVLVHKLSLSLINYHNNDKTEPNPETNLTRARAINNVSSIKKLT